MAEKQKQQGAAPAGARVEPIAPDYKKWVADYKATVESLGGISGGVKPSSGVVGAVTALRHLRDLLLSETLAPGDTSVEAVFFRDNVKAVLNSRLKAIVAKGSVEDGWLSNASAAAKAAGFKVDGASLIQIDE